MFLKALLNEIKKITSKLSLLEEWIDYFQQEGQFNLKDFKPLKNALDFLEGYFLHLRSILNCLNPCLRDLREDQIMVEK